MSDSFRYLSLAFLIYFELTMIAAVVVILRARKHGGLWFARVGRVGGSVYVTRRRRCWRVDAGAILRDVLAAKGR